MPPIDENMFDDNQRLIDRVIQLVGKSSGANKIRIKATTPLLSGQNVFDSYQLMEFILRLEDTFGIRIPDGDLDPDIFHSPRTIVDYLNSRLEQDV